MMKTFVFCSLLAILIVICQGAPEWVFNSDGRITLKSAENGNLCVRTEILNSANSVMKLAPCNKVYEAYAGEKRLGKGKVANGFYQLRTLHVPRPSGFGVFHCLYTVFKQGTTNGGNVPVYTEKCDSDNEWHHWSFRSVGSNVLWVHKKTNYCIRAPTISDGAELVTAQCNENDKNQLFTMENV